MSKTTTVDADGDVISTSVGTNSASIKFSRSVSDGNYGSESCDLFLQLDVTDESADELEARIKATAAFAKTIVYGQLGIDSTLSDDGIVVGVQPEVEAKPKAKSNYTKPGKPAPAASSGEAAPKGDALWQLLVDDANKFYDNRPKKEAGEYSSKSPDFKHKDSGDGLWLDSKSTPAFAKLAFGVEV